ncbi:iron-sulfur cluster repair di-iron protein [Pontimicrobium sp. SW4]|uniref:Iron-sulfur cluster repair di-iron protein n=1 Tax=Pontimicrobium sp. SW4 TaxID=3153519 RepID=A0AAU7BNI1_9FLAO
MKVKENNTVAEVVVDNIKAAHVFKKYGIDFCCGGGITLEKACKNNNADFDALKAEIEALDTNTNRLYNYDKWELDFLIDHIVNIHHTYVEENIPILLQYANKVAKVHGHHYTEVVKINNLVEAVVKELAAHMKKEELILFPYIKQQVRALKEGVKPPTPHFGSVNNPIDMMLDEHETAGDIFKEIAALSNNYAPPEEACNTFRALYSKLEEFEQDLHQHIHLENNILFPKAIQLEQ